MMTKTIAERDRIDTSIAMRDQKRSRTAKISMLLEYQAKHGCVDGDLLEAFATGEYGRGFRSGVDDALYGEP